jgi:hypothetical protein
LLDPAGAACATATVKAAIAQQSDPSRRRMPDRYTAVARTDNFVMFKVRRARSRRAPG